MVKDMFASSALRVCSVQLPNSFDTFGRMCVCVSWRVRPSVRESGIQPSDPIVNFVCPHQKTLSFHTLQIQNFTIFPSRLIFFGLFFSFLPDQAFSANQIAHEINLENDALVFVSLMAREVMFSSLNFSCHIQRVQHDFGEGSPK